MAVLVLAPERMLTPTVAVICVVALADCGDMRVQSMPTATSTATARTLITIRPTLGPSKGNLAANHFSHKSHRILSTLRPPHSSLQARNGLTRELHGCNSLSHGSHVKVVVS